MAQRWNFFFRPDDSLSTPLKNCTAFQHVVIGRSFGKKNGRRMGGPPGALPSKEKISAGRKEGDDHFKKKTLHPPFTDLQWGVSTCSNTSTRGERFLLPNHTLVFVPRSDSLVNKKAIPTLLAHTHSLYESMKIFSEISKETGGLTPPPLFLCVRRWNAKHAHREVL